MTDLLLARQTQGQALEARFALRVAAALGERGVEHDIEQRLRVARDLAISKARRSPAVVAQSGGVAVLAGSAWWIRLASVAPLAALVVGLVLIQHIDTAEQIRAAAEIDAVLLADELPPRAYSDPGFAEFLKQPGP